MAASNPQSKRYSFGTVRKDWVQQQGIGQPFNREKSEEYEERRTRLVQATEVIAHNLVEGSGGKINPYRTDQEISQINLTSGYVEPKTSLYQNWNILPLVASQNRREDTAALELYLHLCEQRDGPIIIDRDGQAHEVSATHPGKVLQHRYMVLTGGPRIPLGMIECRIIYIRQLLKKCLKLLSDFNIPIHIAFQSVEVTLKRDAQDIVWTHPHINILYRFDRWLSDDEWQQFLALMHRGMSGCGWKECGVLRDAHEVSKYVTKILIKDEDEEEINTSVGEELALENTSKKKDYGENIGLLDLTPDELCEYFYQLGPRDRAGKIRRRKLQLPLGDFRTFKKCLKVWGVGFRTFWDGEQFQTAPVAKERRPKRGNSDVWTPGNSGPKENIILGETLPHPDGLTGRTTVSLLVAHYTKNPVTDGGKRRLETILAYAEFRCLQAAANGAVIDIDEVLDRVDGTEVLPVPSYDAGEGEGQPVEAEDQLEFTTGTIAGKPSSALCRPSNDNRKPALPRNNVAPHLSDFAFIQRLTSHGPPRIRESRFAAVG